jgi:hypothetical protein
MYIANVQSMVAALGFSAAAGATAMPNAIKLHAATAYSLTLLVVMFLPPSGEWAAPYLRMARHWRRRTAVPDGVASAGAPSAISELEGQVRTNPQVCSTTEPRGHVIHRQGQKPVVPGFEADAGNQTPNLFKYPFKYGEHGVSF